jgi:hypothetical protein
MKTLTAAIAAGIFSTCFLSLASTPDLPSCDAYWPAATCNYTAASRPSTYPISYVVIHKAEGSASSAASWFQNCAAASSAHYSFDKDSGYCYQSVLEKDVAWHAGNWWYNCRSVGIEHGGYTANNDTGTACYNESAIETKSCIVYYTVLWDRSHILGHKEVPGATHTDPGAYWNWTYYMSKCNPNPVTPQTYIVDNTNGGFSCSANWATGTSASDKYGTSYRYRSTAAISDAAQWTANLANAGNFTISAWWSAGANRSASAPYVLPTGTTVNKNQQANGGSWQSLGTVNLGSGNRTTKLSCWTTTGYVVIADAIKYYGPQ